VEINRKQILESLLDTIACISNKAYQRRVWINGEGPEVDDFDETVCYFFQGIDDIIDKYREFKLTEAQCQVLKLFRNEFEKFSDDNNFPYLFIDTPEWTRITEMAKDVLDHFKGA